MASLLHKVIQKEEMMKTAVWTRKQIENMLDTSSWRKPEIEDFTSWKKKASKTEVKNSWDERDYSEYKKRRNSRINNRFNGRLT